LCNSPVNWDWNLSTMFAVTENLLRTLKPLTKGQESVTPSMLICFATRAKPWVTSNRKGCNEPVPDWDPDTQNVKSGHHRFGASPRKRARGRLCCCRDPQCGVRWGARCIPDTCVRNSAREFLNYSVFVCVLFSVGSNIRWRSSVSLPLILLAMKNTFFGGVGMAVVGRESQSQQCKQLPWTQLLTEMAKQYVLTSLRDMQQTFNLQYRFQYLK